MKIINNELLGNLSNEAQLNSRKRKNFNFHEASTDPIQRMLNAFEPGTYVRPHRHSFPPKREVFIVLAGEVAVLFFDDAGNIIHRVVLNRDKGMYGVEIEPGAWHSIVSLQSGSVVYEVKDGPYDVPSDKDFAPWAPVEGEMDSIAYLQKMEAPLKND
jgi:cupin fold WbuC family metalloprotein